MLEGAWYTISPWYRPLWSSPCSFQGCRCAGVFVCPHVCGLTLWSAARLQLIARHSCRVLPPSCPPSSSAACIRNAGLSHSKRREFPRQEGVDGAEWVGGKWCSRGLSCSVWATTLYTYSSLTLCLCVLYCSCWLLCVC